MRLSQCGLIAGILLSGFGAAAPLDAASIWKVTGPAGKTLYLGGSIHALQSTDYPLPSAYNRAFDASDKLVFEVDERALEDSSKALFKAGEYPRGDSLKNHVDPRTYDYLKRLFGLMKVPEEKIARYRPWFIALILQAPALHGMSEELGVEEFLVRRARANGKPISGLETTHEHVAIFSGLSDRQSEAMLLLMFIPAERSHGSEGAKMMASWRRGDVDTITAFFTEGFHDFPSLADGVLFARNRKWIPKIENLIRSGKTSFVVVGSAHLGGSEGVVALLKQRGYQLEQM